VELPAVTGVSLPVSILALQTLRRAPLPHWVGLTSDLQDVLSPALASHTAIARLVLRTIQRAVPASGVQHLPLRATLAVTSQEHNARPRRSKPVKRRPHPLPSLLLLALVKRPQLQVLLLPVQRLLPGLLLLQGQVLLL